MSKQLLSEKKISPSSNAELGQLFVTPPPTVPGTSSCSFSRPSVIEGMVIAITQKPLATAEMTLKNNDNNFGYSYPSKEQ